MSISPPNSIELERLERVSHAGLYAPSGVLEQTGMRVLSMCGWLREVGDGVFEITDEGKQYLKGDGNG